ncbi:uncharacterized protein LOC120845796 [Ixodes scapularis]|uniref:uncharacterized protein LOC120845796 n=1 Tax=Ixodes scapularis TaxID=6945 RepID=UPI001A9DE1F3|nr:uncharacterized protein LOC120845796 [Ixodes scapularis]
MAPAPKVKKATQTHCFAPGCTSGYVSSRQSDRRVSLFAAPKDPERFEAWQRAIPRADKTLDARSVLCDLHFDEQFIVRVFTHVINGQTVTIPRDRPVLTSDAIPTIFPNVPSYLSKKPPQKRKSKTSSCGLPSKTLRPEASTSLPVEVCGTDAEVNHSRAAPPVDLPLISDLWNCELPSPYWAKHLVAGADKVTVFTVCALDGQSLCFEKVVLVTANDQAVRATVFVQATEVKIVELVNVEMAEELLRQVDSLTPCKGFGEKGEFPTNPRRRTKACGGKNFSASCPGISQTPGKPCPQCKYLRKLLLNQASYKKRTAKARARTPSYKTKLRNAQLKRCRVSISKLKSKIHNLRRKSAETDTSSFEDKIKNMPVKQQQQIKACLAASRRKSTKGMKYESEWVLECAVMCMKSPRLYEHIRKNKIMILPSRTSLRRYLKSYRSGFGLSEKLFAAVAEKTRSMNSFQCHGGLLIDEMKLSEHLRLASDGNIEGFVDLGKLTPESQKTLGCDHGLVIMFQPFTGKWHQILGVFASHSNVKAETLTQIILEAVIMSENAGLHVDFITCDGAAWNRSMWRSFGISATKDKTVCRRQHPTDPERFLYFVSDFPHLVKCVRNSFVRTGLKTPEGHATVDHLDCARKCDERHDTTLKAMPHVNKSVVRPNGFEKMRVNYAFRLFSDEALRGLFLYEDEIERQHGSTAATISFVERMRMLIEAMTSRCSSGALRPGNVQEECIKSFLAYLDKWEEAAGGQGYLSRSAAEGLRVTLSSTLSLLKYVTSELQYRYIMTFRMSQDGIERLFGIVRQMLGCNDHPTPSQFLISINCLSFQNLAKSPPHGNVSSGLLKSLVGVDDAKETMSQKRVDELLDVGDLTEAYKVLSGCGIEHTAMVAQASDSRLIFYIAGYVARKSIVGTKCDECCHELLQRKDGPAPASACLTAAVDRGGLVYPSAKLNALVRSLENTFTYCFSVKQVRRESLMDLVSFLQVTKLTLVGCSDHSVPLTNKIIKFYVLTRLHFHVKTQNSKRKERRERMRLLKQRRVL